MHSGSICLVLFVLIGSTQCSATGLLKPSINSANVSSWMGDLPVAVRQGPFKNLVLPGSHDSATYTLDVAATPSMQDSIYQVLLDLLNDPLTALVAKAPVEDLTETQQGPIAPFQLEEGIRAFDLRVLYNPNNSKVNADPFFFSHSFAAVPMNKTLRAIAFFFDSHPTEFAIFQLSVDWEHRTQTTPMLGVVASIVQDILGDYLLPVQTDPSYFTNASLDGFISKGHRILFSMEAASTVVPLANIWPSSTVNTFWPNGQTVNESMSAIDAYLYGGGSGSIPATNDNQLNLVFFTITPSDDSIIDNVLSHLGNLTNVTSLRDYARMMRGPTMALLPQAVLVDKKKISIVSVDWPNDELISSIIALNYDAER